MVESDSLPFSQLLRQATAEEHAAAEESPFVERLLTGECDQAEFAHYTAQLLPIYQALERRVDADPLRRRFADPRLNRVPALRQDLAYFARQGWLEPRAPLPATTAYAARIDDIGESTPAFVAHHYTRYLGDLSGGRVIARRVAQHLGLREDGPGLAFYDFPEIDKPKVFKDHYRHQLDSASWTAADRETLIAEARLAFRLNQAVFQEMTS
ncbi:MAG: heme oxygenase (biliverdin-producing) [Beutenbergiaceae bacterium]